MGTFKINLFPLNNSKELLEEVESFLLEWNNTENFILQKTSGSTGKPKEIKIEKKYMVASAETTNRFFNIDADSNLLLCISPKFIGGKMMIVRALVAASKLTLTEVKGNPIEQLTEKVDLAAMVPLQTEKIHSHNNFTLIKNLIIGGAPVNENLEVKLSKLSTNCYATFGMTETISHIALRDLKNGKGVYNTLAPTTISIDRSKRLIINAPHLNQKNLVTNDIVELFSNTSFKWLGRSDFTINSGGIKVQPEVLEEKLVTILGSRHYIVTGIKDDVLGEKIVVCIEGEVDNIEEVKLRMKKMFDKYTCPKEIYTLKQFYRTENGKLQRQKIKERLKIEGTIR